MAVVCLLLFPVMTCGGMSTQSTGMMVFGMLLLFVGGPLFIMSSILKWWRHD